MPGTLDPMATPAWGALMRYVTRRLEERVRGDVSDLAADTQLELAGVLAGGSDVSSLHRLADCVLEKHLDRRLRRERRRVVPLDDWSVVADPASTVAPGPAVAPDAPRPPIEKMPAWPLLRGRLERAIARGVWSGQSLVAISQRLRCHPKEIRRVAAELPAKLARRRRALP